MENPFSFKFEIAIFIFPFSLFLLKILDHSSHFSFKLSEISLNSPTQTTQEGNQKDLLLLVSSNGNETSRFAPKSL